MPRYGGSMISNLGIKWKNIIFVPRANALSQARSQEFAMGGGGCFGSLGAETPALENFAFFCKNNLILGLF